MSKERSLKREIKYLLIVPMVLAFLLLAVVFLTMGFGSKESYIAIGIILLYALIVTIAYLKLRPMLNATLVDYALEQGKIQKELLKNLAVPYAILDTTGRILWSNRMFRNNICNGEKHVKKRLEYYFPELTDDVFAGVDNISMELPFGDKIEKGAYHARLVYEDSVLKPVNVAATVGTVIPDTYVPRVQAENNVAEFTVSGSRNRNTVVVSGFDKLAKPSVSVKNGDSWEDYKFSVEDYDGYQVQMSPDGTYSYSFVYEIGDPSDSITFKVSVGG